MLEFERNFFFLCFFTAKLSDIFGAINFVRQGGNKATLTEEFGFENRKKIKNGTFKTDRNF